MNFNHQPNGVISIHFEVDELRELRNRDEILMLQLDRLIDSVLFVIDYPHSPLATSLTAKQAVEEMAEGLLISVTVISNWRVEPESAD